MLLLVVRRRSLFCEMVCGTDIYLWRQSLSLIALSFYGVAVGIVLAFPAILNPVILSPNATDIRATPDEASWITSIYGFAGMFGFCTIPGIMQKYGRKAAHMTMNITLTIGSILLVVANDVPILYAARCMQGLSVCGVYLTALMLAEYADKDIRGIFITLHKSTLALGSMLCHASVLICNWREVAAAASVASFIATIVTFLWPESPAYLAMIGRYEECGKSYTYLHGDTLKVKKELEDLISAQMERREQEKTVRKKDKLSTVCKKLLKKDFLKPFFIITLLTVIMDSCGRYYNLAYIVQIIQDITGDNSLGIYCSIGLDFLTIVASWTSAYVVTKFRRRQTLLSFGYLSVALMFIITLTVYLKSANIMSQWAWLTPCIVLLNSFLVNLGIIPVCFTVAGVIYPLEHKGTGFTATGLMFTLLFGVSMKFTPLLMEKTGIEGTYGIYGLCMLICFVILHFILPETKDKTLQEIEDEMKGINRHQGVNLLEKELLTIS